jgi:hypothetical protein
MSFTTLRICVYSLTRISAYDSTAFPDATVPMSIQFGRILYGVIGAVDHLLWRCWTDADDLEPAVSVAGNISISPGAVRGADGLRSRRFHADYAVLE